MIKAKYPFNKSGYREEYIMIQSIYETHLHVRNLEKAIDFYQNKLGLTLAKTIGKAGCFLMGRRK